MDQPNLARPGLHTPAFITLSLRILREGPSGLNVESYQYFCVSIRQIDPIRFPVQPLGKGYFLCLPSNFSCLWDPSTKHFFAIFLPSYRHDFALWALEIFRKLVALAFSRHNKKERWSVWARRENCIFKKNTLTDLWNGFHCWPFISSFSRIVFSTNTPPSSAF